MSGIDTKQEKGRVYVIDDDDAIRTGLERLLRSAGYQVSVFKSGQDFLATGDLPRKGCILLDIKMPGLSGLDLQHELLKKDAYILPMVFLTGYGDVNLSVQAMKAGAVDFLEKPINDEALLKAVRRALAQDEITRQSFFKKQETWDKIELLTPREFDVLRLVITGMLNKQIGAELGIAEKTVKVHRGRVMEKMGVVSVAELVRMTEQAGLQPGVFSPPE